MADQKPTWPLYPFDPDRKAHMSPDDAVTRAIRTRFADWDPAKPNWSVIEQHLYDRGRTPEQLRVMDVYAIRDSFGAGLLTFSGQVATHTMETTGPLLGTLLAFRDGELVAPTKPGRAVAGKSRRPMTDEEIERKAKKYLEKRERHLDFASARELAKYLGIALGKITAIPSWQRHYRLGQKFREKQSREIKYSQAKELDKIVRQHNRYATPSPVIGKDAPLKPFRRH